MAKKDKTTQKSEQILYTDASVKTVCEKVQNMEPLITSEQAVFNKAVMNTLCIMRSSL